MIVSRTLLIENHNTTCRCHRKINGLRNGHEKFIHGWMNVERCKEKVRSQMCIPINIIEWWNDGFWGRGIQKRCVLKLAMQLKRYSTENDSEQWLHAEKLKEREVTSFPDISNQRPDLIRRTLEFITDVLCLLVVIVSLDMPCCIVCQIWLRVCGVIESVHLH